jgi:hypothetical protein
MYGSYLVVAVTLMPTGTCNSQILRLERLDAEVVYRALVGLGNAVS